MLTIDLLRSMIHNLVIGQWGTCSHRAGTVALAHRANIAERTSRLTCGSFSSILFVSLPFVVGSKHHKTFSKRSSVISFSHQCYCLCICRSLLYPWTLFLSLKICVKNIMAQENI